MPEPTYTITITESERTAVLRSILLAEDLRDDPAMLEAVAARLGELEVEMGELAGRQQMFEVWVK